MSFCHDMNKCNSQQKRSALLFPPDSGFLFEFHPRCTIVIQVSNPERVVNGFFNDFGQSAVDSRSLQSHTEIEKVVQDQIGRANELVVFGSGIDQSY